MRVLREGPVRITKATVDAAWRRRAQERRSVVSDAGCRGLALVVNPPAWRGPSTTGRAAWTRARASASPRAASPSATPRPTRRTRPATRPTRSRARPRPEPTRPPTKRRRSPPTPSAARLHAGPAGSKTTRRTCPTAPKLRGAGKLSAGHVAGGTGPRQGRRGGHGGGGKPVADVGSGRLPAHAARQPAQPGAARHRFGALCRFFDWCRTKGTSRRTPARDRQGAPAEGGPGAACTTSRPEELAGSGRRGRGGGLRRTPGSGALPDRRAVPPRGGRDAWSGRTST